MKSLFPFHIGIGIGIGTFYFRAYGTKERKLREKHREPSLDDEQASDKMEWE